MICSGTEVGISVGIFDDLLKEHGKDLIVKYKNF